MYLFKLIKYQDGGIFTPIFFHYWYSISNIFLNKGIQGGGVVFRVFCVFFDFQQRKKVIQNVLTTPIMNQGNNIEQNWKFMYFTTPSGGYPAVQKISSGGGGVAFREISLFFYRFQESKSIIQNESTTSILYIRDLIDQNWKSVLFFIPSGGCPATQKNMQVHVLKMLFFCKNFKFL